MNSGGGIKSRGSQILNNVIRGNHANNGGGGIHGGGTVTGNIIINNTGAGVYTNTGISLSNNFILNNSGVGVRGESAQLTVTGNVIAGNQTGAMDIRGDKTESITNNTIFGNTGSSIINHYCTTNDSIEFKNNTIVGNNVTGDYAVQFRTHPSYGNGNILFNNNNIYDNGGTYELSNQSALGTADLNVENNYWGPVMPQ